MEPEPEAKRAKLDKEPKLDDSNMESGKKIFIFSSPGKTDCPLAIYSNWRLTEFLLKTLTEEWNLVPANVRLTSHDADGSIAQPCYEMLNLSHIQVRLDHNFLQQHNPGGQTSEAKKCSTTTWDAMPSSGGCKRNALDNTGTNSDLQGEPKTNNTNTPPLLEPTPTIDEELTSVLKTLGIRPWTPEEPRAAGPEVIMVGYEPPEGSNAVEQWHRTLARIGIYTKGFFPSQYGNAEPKGGENKRPAVASDKGTMSWYHTTRGKRMRIDAESKDA